MRFALLLALLSACATKQPTSGSSGAALEGGCEAPEAHGAVADDGLDDRVALQETIVAAQAGSKRVCLGDGQYHVTRDPRPNKQWIASLIASGPIEIYGTGRDSTSISMLGGIVGRRDWRILDCSGPGCSIHDLAFDGETRCPGWTEGDALCTGDQTHLVQINGPATDYVIERLRVTLPPLPYGSSGGDCVRLIGSHDAWVTNGVIRDVVGPNCDRSFIGIQRAVDGLLIEGVESVIVGDQAIDLEPTGETSFAGEPIVKNVVIRRSRLARGPDAQGPYVMGINGGGDSTISGLRIEDVVFDADAGGLFISDVEDVELTRLHLRNRVSRAEPTVLAQKRIKRLQFVSTTLERVAGSPSGSVLKVNEKSGNAPESVYFLGGAVVQGGEGVPISTVSLSSLAMVYTKIFHGGTTPTFAVVAQGQSFPAGVAVMADVTLSGSLDGAVKMAGTFVGPPVLVRVSVQP